MGKIINKIIDHSIEIFYSKDKTKLYVIFLFLLGFVFRLIAANNMGLSADDSIHAVRAVGAIESNKLVEYGQSSMLWYCIQEIFYKIFGANQMGSRFASVLFGSFFIILIYLFTKEIFKSSKVGLISSFLMALSPFLIKMTLPEMDVTTLFFIIFSALFLFRFMEKGDIKNIILSSVSIGIAVLIKVYTLFFVFSYFIFLLFFYWKNHNLDKGSIKKIFLFLGIIFIFCIPTIAHNYLLYKDKGFMDLMSTNFLKIGLDNAKQFYDQGPTFWMPYTDFKGFFFGHQKNFGGENAVGIFQLPGFIVMILLSIREDPILMICGLIGLLLLIYKKNWKYVLFFVFSFMPAFIYLGSHIPMLKHFTFIPVLFLPLAAKFIEEADNLIKKSFPKFRLRYLLIFILLFNVFWLGHSQMGLRPSIYSASEESRLISFRDAEISQNSLVLLDSRIYRGYIGWMFSNRNYLEASLFSSAITESNKYGNFIPIEVYFIECISDDCGWGTIKDQPEFNKSMENIVMWFENNSKILEEIKTFDETRGYIPFLMHPEQIPAYKIYKTSLTLSPVILQMAQLTHNIILYPLGYDESISEIFDKYETHSFTDKMIDKLAHLIFKLALAIPFLALIFLVWIFIENS